MEPDNSVANLFNDLDAKGNVKRLPVDAAIASTFHERFEAYAEKLFFKVACCCGGIVVDNWIRLYGCGALNILSKNDALNGSGTCGIIIGEDVCGGLFALRDNIVQYFAPDTLAWESLGVYYSDFLFWILNNTEGTTRFYAAFRWDGWEQFCEDIGINQGISFYPQLCFERGSEERNKRIVSIDEIITMNFNLAEKFCRL